MCTGYDPCPSGEYGNGSPEIDVIGWFEILMSIFW